MKRILGICSPAGTGMNGIFEEIPASSSYIISGCHDIKISVIENGGQPGKKVNPDMTTQ
jgi:hypothetical protein